MASLVTITGTVTDPSGTGLNNPVNSNAFVRFILRNWEGYVPFIFGTNIIAEIQVDCIPGADGDFSQQLWPNSAITPSTTFYTVQFFSQGRVVSSGNWIFNGNTNLNTSAQLNAPPVPPGFLLVLENNGALNSSQSTLNLESSDGSVVITDLGNGTLNLQVRSAPPS